MQNLYSLVLVVFKRLWHNLGLSISAIAGIVAVLAIVVCVPIFSYSVSSQVLRNQLEEKAKSTHRSLFSLHLYHLGTKNVVLDVDKVKGLTNYIRKRAPELMGVNVGQVEEEVQSNTLRLVPEVPNRYGNSTEALKSVRFLVNESLPAHADIIDGEWPAADPSSTGPIKVAIPQSLADELFINVGDRFMLDKMEIEISGIWTPKNPKDNFWFEDAISAYADKIWIPEETFQKRISPQLAKPIFYSSWYVIMNENSLSFVRAPQYARGLMRLDKDLGEQISGITVDYSPLDALLDYQKRADSLITLFAAVGTPLIVLALLFIGLTSTISVQQYEQEIVTMRGRGTSRGQVMAMNLIESSILILVSFPLAILGGWIAVGVMSRTLSFMQFTQRSVFPFSFSGINFWLLLLAALLILAARFLPILDISRSTIIHMKQDQARSSKKPIWERFYLDFFLLIPAAYSYFVMSGWTKPSGILAKMQLSGQQYRDPLLFIAPALFAIAMCMITLRIVPLVVRLLAIIIDRIPGVWAYLSLQQIARRPQDYSSAMLLIMISLGLAIFSASTAKTLDQWIYDSIFYNTGADLSVQEYLVSSPQSMMSMMPSSGNPTGGTTLTDLSATSEGYVSPEEHEKLPSVERATRVGKYPGSFSFGVGETIGIIMGVDRAVFPSIAFFRNDFAGQSLGALMNTLGADPNGVLVPSEVAKQMGLKVGDRINVDVNILDVPLSREMVVAGVYNYFPTVYPTDKPTLIVNLESLFDNPDAVTGYDLWFKLRTNAKIDILLYQIRQMLGGEKAMVKVTGNAVDRIQTALNQPERVGLFGVLNVGFMITGLMPAIGFVLYSYASLRRRFIQLGILQALGLSIKQLIGYLALEQILLMGVAILGGAAIGLLTSYLYVPFLQVGAAPGSPIPPFQVLIGWTEAIWLSVIFGIVLFLTMTTTILYLVRLQVFQAVKLGETL